MTNPFSKLGLVCKGEEGRASGQDLLTSQTSVLLHYIRTELALVDKCLFLTLRNRFFFAVSIFFQKNVYFSE